MHFPQTEYNEVCNLVKFSLGISIPLKFLLEQRNSPVAPNNTDTGLSYEYGYHDH